MCDSKLIMTKLEAKMFDEDANKTPRSRLNSDGTTACDNQSPGSTSPPGSRSDSKCAEDEDDLLEHDQPSESEEEDDDDNKSGYREDEYYAFLREMAGSFEATREDDDESEVGSDSSGSSDEDEEDQAVGRKRSSSFSDDDYSDTGLAAASLKFEGRGRALGAGSPEEECMKARASLAGQCVPVQPSRGGYPANMAASSGGPRQQPWPLPAAVQTPPVPRPPVVDTRGPVEDDYDVISATAEYAEQFPLSHSDRQREDLREAIRLRTDQAEKLLATASKKQLSSELRSHYGSVRAELLVEACSLVEELNALVEAQQQQQPTQTGSCSQQVGHQESFGGQAPAVVVK